MLLTITQSVKGRIWISSLYDSITPMTSWNVQLQMWLILIEKLVLPKHLGHSIPLGLSWHYTSLCFQVSLTYSQIRRKLFPPNRNIGKKIICSWISINIQRKTALNHNMKMTEIFCCILYPQFKGFFFLDNECRAHEIFNDVNRRTNRQDCQKVMLIVERLYGKCKFLILIWISLNIS